MILSMVEPIEEFWSEILSREPDRIRAAYEALSAKEKKAVLDHLTRMVTEDGWHPEQFVSASQALDALEKEG